jgi:hypothetical protein
MMKPETPTKAELKALVAHYKQLSEEGMEPRIKEMRLEDGSFNLSVTGPMVEAMGIALVGQFKQGGATNFMEMSFSDRDEPYQRYIVTVQKAGAKSPADLLSEAKARIAQLEQMLPMPMRDA